MEIDFRTAREALIYEIGLKTGLLQRETELQKKLLPKNTVPANAVIQKLQQNIDFTINVIKGL